jgi:hypothetical protein
MTEVLLDPFHCGESSIEELQGWLVPPVGPGEEVAGEVDFI